MDKKESRDKEETDMLFDKIGNTFRKLPSLAVSKQNNLKSKREQLNQNKIKIDLSTSPISKTKNKKAIVDPTSNMKLVDY